MTTSLRTVDHAPELACLVLLPGCGKRFDDVDGAGLR